MLKSKLSSNIGIESLSTSVVDSCGTAAWVDKANNPKSEDLGEFHCVELILQ